MMKMKMRSLEACCRPMLMRAFSTPAGKAVLTPEQIKEGIIRGEKYRDLQRPTSKLLTLAFLCCNDRLLYYFLSQAAQFVDCHG